MDDYISREAVERFIENGLNNPDKKKAFGHDAVEILTEVHFMDAADVRPVVYGEWIGVDCSYWRHAAWGAYPVKRIRYKCSVCGRIENQKEPFCNCGAEMTGGADNG